MTKAYHITGWRQRYEVTIKGTEAKVDTGLEQIKKGPLRFVRSKVYGHNKGPTWCELVRLCWNWAGMDLAIFGLFQKLLELAADQEREYRGWILDHRQEPLDAEGIQKVLGTADLDVVKKGLEILVNPAIDWLEFVEMPQQIDTFQNLPGNYGKSQDLLFDDSGKPKTLAADETKRNVTEPNNNITETIPGESLESDSVLASLCPNSDFDSTPVFTLHLRAGMLLNDMIPPKNNGDRTCQKELLEMVKTAIELGRCEKDIYQDVFKAAQISTRPEIERPMGKFVIEMQSLGFKLRSKKKVTT